MPQAWELTCCSEDGSAKPCELYSIQGLNISKTSNKYPEPSLQGENGLYRLKEINSVNQAFDMHQVLRKCKVVQDWFSCSCQDNFPTDYEREKLLTNLNRKNSKQSSVQKDCEQLIQVNMIRAAL